MTGLKAAISAIAVHPSQPYLAVAQDDGYIGIYNYEHNFQMVKLDDVTKKDKKSNDKAAERIPKLGDTKDGKPPRKRLITCLEFTPEGELLIALAKGKIEVMSMDDMVIDEYPSDLSTSDTGNAVPITLLVVSHDGKYFAVADEKNCVCLYKKDHNNGDPEAEICW